MKREPRNSNNPNYAEYDVEMDTAHDIQIQGEYQEESSSSVHDNDAGNDDYNDEDYQISGNDRSAGNSVKSSSSGRASGPGPACASSVRALTQKIKTLESKVVKLESELRLMKRKISSTSFVAGSSSNSYHFEEVKEFVINFLEDQAYSMITSIRKARKSKLELQVLIF